MKWPRQSIKNCINGVEHFHLVLDAREQSLEQQKNLSLQPEPVGCMNTRTCLTEKMPNENPPLTSSLILVDHRQDVKNQLRAPGI